ncbi:acid-sensing ion channel 1C-like [Branchiostoma floridae x Branchiostoma japonicum]
MSPEDEKESPEKEFAGNTTLHGLNRIFIAPSKYFRAWWIFVILASYAGFGYMFGSMIYSYFTYDTITDTRLEFKAGDIPFPAVTICNMNKFDASKLKVADWYYLSMLLNGVQLNVSTILASGVPPDETVNSTLNIEDMKIEDIVREKGFEVSPLRLKLCFWKGIFCTSMNFTHSFNYFGNCYTFNADVNNPLKQTMEGSGNGFMAFLDIIVDDYTENYFTGGVSEIGLKLLVHDPREPAIMDTQGIALAPGNHAFISIKRTLYENHVPPWGVCEDRQLEYYDTYTLPACYLECRSKHIVANCGCRPFYLPGTL